MQISSRIDLQLYCQCNDSTASVSSIKRVDQTLRTADFHDESLVIDLAKVRGRTRQSKNSVNLSGSIDMNSSMQTQTTRKDLVICTLKLFAVRDKDQKLIGLVSFEVDWQSDKSTLMENKVLPFQKCIDPKASISLTAKLVQTENEKAVLADEDLPEAATKVSIVPRRQIPRLDRLKTCQSQSYQESFNRSIIDDDVFSNMEDVSETCDEGQRPHEAIETITSRDTPLKRNALAAKQKSTYRNSRRASKNPSPRKKPGQNQSNVSQSGTFQKALIIDRTRHAPTEEQKSPKKIDKTKQQNQLEDSPTATQFSINPYMELRTKPSDAPNNPFFNLLTIPGRQATAMSESKDKMGPASGVSLTSRQTNTFQQFYESITKPFFNAADESSQKGPYENNARGQPDFSKSNTIPDKLQLRSQSSNNRQYANAKIQNAQQQKKEQARIVSLQQELQIVKREKKFIMEKLNEVSSNVPDRTKEIENRMIHEQKRSEQAEQSVQLLKGELDLIQQQLTSEEEKSKRQRSHLGLEEQITEHQEMTQSPSISISEQILLKYKRSTELCSMFEQKYQKQCQEVKDLSLQTASQEGAIQQRDTRISQLLEEVSQLQNKNELIKSQHAAKHNELREEKNAVEKEKEFLQHDSNNKELQLSDLRSKLRKRGDELQALKDGLNSQIQQVHASFEDENQSQTRTINMLRESLNQKQTELDAHKEIADVKQSEAHEACEKLGRQREVLRQNGEELVECQSKAADLDERLVQTEQHLINAKSSWAECEHDKEILLGKIQALDEILRTQYEGGIEALLMAHDQKL